MLKTDYKDDVLNTDANVNRKFSIVRSNGTVVEQNVELRETTAFKQIGDSFGAKDINEINKTINGMKYISSISKTGTNELVDTYTTTYNDGTTSTFTVINGLTTIKRVREPDNGYYKYMLLFDITVWANTDTGGGVYVDARGFNGIVIENRANGYIGVNGFYTVIMAASDTGRVNGNVIKSDDDKRLLLRTSSNDFPIYIIKDTKNSKYYLAIKRFGSHADIVFSGIFSGTPMEETWIQCDASGNLPEGWAVYSDGYKLLSDSSITNSDIDTILNS